MPVFYEQVEPPEHASVKGALKEALNKDPAEVGDVDKEAEERAAEIAPAGYARFNAGRFVGALVLWALIVVAGIVTEATDLEKSSDALWGAAAIVFGVIVGFLAGEQSASGRTR
jgi:hypothetical protein